MGNYIIENLKNVSPSGNFDRDIVLTDKALCELRRWIDNIRTIKRPIHPPDIDLIIHSDTSKMEWGNTEDFQVVDFRMRKVICMSISRN